MNIVQIIEIAAAFITGGGLAGLVTLRQTKEGKEIENTSNLLKEYKELLQLHKEDAEKEKTHALQSDMKVEQLAKKVSELQIQMTKVQQQLATSHLLYSNASLLKCDKLDCQYRRPPLDKKALESIAEENKDEE